MAIQKKFGKGRLDKWYKLAKEKGYRARAAFKLIQLNKKYNFLEKSKVLIDLCAAPGSWCQVAAECMPAQSLIVGVDLAPIKPIPRTITFQSDITTEKCRATLRQDLKTWKADAVLHDGAPNVGTAWVQDAFTQAELVLQSLKLAVEFLRPGGTFVTKVFRSKDYNSLLWVFKQLFKTVEATKPPSSRNVSAEIFVVCLGFKAPKHVDPKFLDPRHVFAELQDPTPNNEAKVFNPEKKKRRREGYEEGDYTQFKELPVSEFINTTDPIAILGSYNKLSFSQHPNGDLALATLERLPETTEEIKLCCEDLKVLGKKEFRTLLRWRLKVREIFGLSTKKAAQPAETEEVADVQPMDEELAIQEELQRQRDMQKAKKRKERRKENERKQKDLMRMQMHMTTPMDIGQEQVGPFGENSVFNLKTAQKAGDIKKVSGAQMAAESSSDEDSSDENDYDSEEEEIRLERELDSMYERYQADKEERDAKARVKRVRKDMEDDTFEGFSDKEDASESDEGESKDAFALKTPSKDGALSNKAALFFDQAIFNELGDLGIEDEEEKSDVKSNSADKKAKENDKNQESQEIESEVSDSEDDEEESEEEEVEDDDDAEYDDGSASAPATTKKSKASKKEAKTGNTEGTSDGELEDPKKKNGQLDIEIITAEAMALAQSMASGEKKSQDVVDDAFNRYTFRDVENLPEWFLDDEGKHSKPQKPISAAAAAAIREKLRAINARPIKKVMEAKGRKKMKAAQRLEKLKKKSALLADDESISEKDKAQTIARMMNRAMKKKPKQNVRLVVAKGANRGISGRPKGVKGKYKIVDARLKKDIRAQKRAAKKHKR